MHADVAGICKEASFSADGAGTVSYTHLDVYKRQGAGSAVAFDINAACSGFLFGLATADAYFKTGRFHKAVVVGAEVLSKIMDWNDRSTCCLLYTSRCV